VLQIVRLVTLPQLSAAQHVMMVTIAIRVTIMFVRRVTQIAKLAVDPTQISVFHVIALARYLFWMAPSVLQETIAPQLLDQVLLVQESVIIVILVVVLAQAQLTPIV